MDRIEREIAIAAPIERVWQIVTEGDWLSPAKVDLRPGGLIIFDHGPHGDLPARIVEVDEPKLFSFRWTGHGRPDEEPVEGNSTLVVFRLAPDGGSTLLRVTESGFGELPEEDRQVRFQINAAGWVGLMERLQKSCES
jgi:uncharacterized protein YndB with AHSA1/START domain